MINREQLKLEIDSIDERHIEVLHRIILALKQPLLTSTLTEKTSEINPLKGSVTFEHDLVSPIDMSWDAEQ
ncbi:hypothetical protein C7H19_10890 [Aphanothece hegewaldii CCALA 016]|uniref:Uncharacterized protein n=1 Tax=Aphanothece hegewaldii CCALA 016 TaxID=2107694 RepID=A0A2T1LY31_9CHRO|nr:hypothetical protein [Aphanothece hegewaldii]PSF37219.1 hypothetical protein C7H19_10890 [Aphanothece hegewaldii CCALA 016]